MSNFIYLPNEEDNLGSEVIVNIDQIVMIEEHIKSKWDTTIIVSWLNGSSTIEENQSGVFHRLFRAMKCQNS